ncbi:MAG: hypothetical protein AB7H90_11570 [Alphaproteobacteria bacterium]
MPIQADAYKFLLGFDYRTDNKVVGPHPLKDWLKAPAQPGIYEIGFGSTRAMFNPRYLGKAVRQTLQKRLQQHFMHSSNTFINQHKNECYFTCRPIEAANHQKAVINNIEGLYLIAFSEQYVWNKRQEWLQHWSVADFTDT